MTTKLAALALALSLSTAAGALAAPTAEKAERAADRVMVSWTAPAPVDVYVADRADAPASETRLVSKADADGRFEYPGAGRVYFLLKDTQDGRSAWVAERVVPLAQGSNFRDIGGYAGAGGKRVRWGRIYRSGGTPMLTDADLGAVKTLGLKTMLDLRSSEERVLAPTRIEGVEYQAVGYSLLGLTRASQNFGGDEGMHAAYRAFPTMLAPQLKILFADLLRGEGPLAYNCSAGQDRTGFTTAVLLGALGVRREDILADYHLSTTYRRPQYEMPKISPAVAEADPVAKLFSGYQTDPRASQPQPLYDSQRQPLLGFALAEVDARWGGIEGYLAKEIGVGPVELAKLRAMYLE